MVGLFSINNLHRPKPITLVKDGITGSEWFLGSTIWAWELKKEDAATEVALAEVSIAYPEFAQERMAGIINENSDNYFWIRLFEKLDLLKALSLTRSTRIYL